MSEIYNKKSIKTLCNEYWVKKEKFIEELKLLTYIDENNKVTELWINKWLVNDTYKWFTYIKIDKELFEQILWTINYFLIYQNWWNYWKISVTEKWEWVRSKSEKFIADRLYNKQIKYEYEKELIINNNKIANPDFRLNEINNCVMEFWGLNSKQYKFNSLIKAKKYKENKIECINIYEWDIINPEKRYFDKNRLENKFKEELKRISNNNELIKTQIDKIIDKLNKEQNIIDNNKYIYLNEISKNENKNNMNEKFILTQSINFIDKKQLIKNKYINYFIYIILLIWWIFFIVISIKNKNYLNTKWNIETTLKIDQNKESETIWENSKIDKNFEIILNNIINDQLLTNQDKCIKLKNWYNNLNLKNDQINNVKKEQIIKAWKSLWC